MKSRTQIENAILETVHARATVDDALYEFEQLAMLNLDSRLHLRSQVHVEVAFEKLRAAERQITIDLSSLALDLYSCLVRERFQPGDRVSVLGIGSQPREMRIVEFLNAAVQVQDANENTRTISYLEIDVRNAEEKSMTNGASQNEFEDDASMSDDEYDDSHTFAAG